MNENRHGAKPRGVRATLHSLKRPVMSLVTTSDRSSSTIRTLATMLLWPVKLHMENKCAAQHTRGSELRTRSRTSDVPPTHRRHTEFVITSHATGALSNPAPMTICDFEAKISSLIAPCAPFKCPLHSHAPPRPCYVHVHAPHHHRRSSASRTVVGANWCPTAVCGRLSRRRQAAACLESM